MRISFFKDAVWFNAKGPTFIDAAKSLAGRWVARQRDVVETFPECLPPRSCMALAALYDQAVSFVDEHAGMPLGKKGRAAREYAAARSLPFAFLGQSTAFFKLREAVEEIECISLPPPLNPSKSPEWCYTHIRLYKAVERLFAVLKQEPTYNIYFGVFSRMNNDPLSLYKPRETVGGLISLQAAYETAKVALPGSEMEALTTLRRNHRPFNPTVAVNRGVFG